MNHVLFHTITLFVTTALSDGLFQQDAQHTAKKMDEDGLRRLQRVLPTLQISQISLR